MIAVDTNLLVYAHREDSPFHPPAFETLRELAEGTAAWAIPWPCIHEFLAIVTHPRIYSPPSPLGVALDQVNAWMESPSVTLLSESEGYWMQFKSVAKGSQISGPRVHDARVAALCQLHRVRELWSADRDFSRFTGLVFHNPLVGINREN